MEIAPLPRGIANLWDLSMREWWQLRHFLSFKDEEVRKIGVRVMNELVEPFQETDIDDEEFACLKAIVFFDPNIAGLQKADEVRKVRKQVQVNVLPFRSTRLHLPLVNDPS